MLRPQTSRQLKYFKTPAARDKKNLTQTDIFLMPNPASTNVTSAVTIQTQPKKRPVTHESSRQRAHFRTNSDCKKPEEKPIDFAAEVEVESHEEPIKITSLMSYLHTGQQTLNSDIPVLTRPRKIFYKFGERFVMKHPP